jgi:hypothetical protein
VAYKASVFRLQIRDDRQYSMTNANISHFDYAAQKYGTQLRAKSFWENPTPTKRKVVPAGQALSSSTTIHHLLLLIFRDDQLPSPFLVS